MPLSHGSTLWTAAAWKKAAAEADKRNGDAVGPNAHDSEDSYSELDEDACATAAAELPRPTSSRKCKQAETAVLSGMCPIKRRALRKAVPLPPPHGSGGPFYGLPRDVLIRLLTDSIGSPEDYAHVATTCLQFNDAAVSKGVLTAVANVATTTARQARDQGLCPC